MTPKEQIDANLTKIRELFDQTTALADEHNIGFSWTYLGYGMGGWYEPKKKVMTRKEALAKLEGNTTLTTDELDKIREVLRNTTNETDEYSEDSWETSSGGWQSSSQGC